MPELENILPELLAVQPALDFQGFLDPGANEPLQGLFVFAVYFFSNKLTRDQKGVFLKWGLDKNYTRQLISFLAIPTVSVNGFRHGLVAAVMGLENLGLVLHLVQTGAWFKEVLAHSRGGGGTIVQTIALYALFLFWLIIVPSAESPHRSLRPDCVLFRERCESVFHREGRRWERHELGPSPWPLFLLLFLPFPFQLRKEAKSKTL